jgi:hypothetical protein
MTTETMELAARLSNMTVAEELALPTEERCAMIRAWHLAQAELAHTKIRAAQARELTSVIAERLDGGTTTEGRGRSTTMVPSGASSSARATAPCRATRRGCGNFSTRRQAGTWCS